LFINPSHIAGFQINAESPIHGMENSSSSNDTQQGRRPPVNTKRFICKLSPKSNGGDDGDGDGEDETTPVKKSLASAKCAGAAGEQKSEKVLRGIVVRMQLLLK